HGREKIERDAVEGHRSPQCVMRRVGWLRATPAQYARLHCRRCAFAIRLLSGPSFREKLDQLVGDTKTKRAQIPAPLSPLLMPHSRQILTTPLALRELEGLARLGAAVLLALHGTGVAGEEAALLQAAAGLGRKIGERLGEAVPPRAGLARRAAAGDRADHVVLPATPRRDQRLLDHHAQHRTGEVDFDLAG